VGATEDPEDRAQARDDAHGGEREGMTTVITPTPTRPTAQSSTPGAI